MIIFHRIEHSKRAWSLKATAVELEMITVIDQTQEVAPPVSRILQRCWYMPDIPQRIQKFVLLKYQQRFTVITPGFSFHYCRSFNIAAKIDQPVCKAGIYSTVLRSSTHPGMLQVA